MPQDRVIAGYYYIMKLIEAFQSIFYLSQSCPYLNLFILFPKSLSTGIINRIIQYIIKYTKVDPRFLI